MGLLHTDIQIGSVYEDPLGQQYKIINIVGFGTAALVELESGKTMHINQFLLLVRKKL